MDDSIQKYNELQFGNDKAICVKLASTIDTILSAEESKIWHAHPVWFIDGNPIVGYSKQKAGWRLMFWSGADFNEDDLSKRGEKFKDASVFYNSAEEIITENVRRWLMKSIEIQWDYKNIIKRKGILIKLTAF